MKVAFIIALIAASVICQAPVDKNVVCTKTVQGMIDATFSAIISGETAPHTIPLSDITGIASSAEAFATQCLNKPFPLPSDSCFASVQSIQAPIVKLVADIKTGNQALIGIDISTLGLKVIEIVSACKPAAVAPTCMVAMKNIMPVIRNYHKSNAKRFGHIKAVVHACL